MCKFLLLLFIELKEYNESTLFLSHCRKITTEVANRIKIPTTIKIVAAYFEIVPAYTMESFCLQFLQRLTLYDGGQLRISVLDFFFCCTNIPKYKLFDDKIPTLRYTYGAPFM